jgi:hypothetical protein
MEIYELLGIHDLTHVFYLSVCPMSTLFRHSIRMTRHETRLKRFNSIRCEILAMRMRGALSPGWVGTPIEILEDAC